MRKKIYLFAIFFFLLVTSGLDTRPQNCYCPQPREILYTHNFSSQKLALCGFEYDKYKKDLIIGEFILQQCSVDTFLIDNFHNEGDAFLFQTNSNGLTITTLDLTRENEKLSYPKKFTQAIIKIINNKPVITYSEVVAESIVKYVEKNFKKLPRRSAIDR